MYFLIFIHLSFSRDIFEIFWAEGRSENPEVPVLFDAAAPPGTTGLIHTMKVGKLKNKNAILGTILPCIHIISVRLWDFKDDGS